MRDILKSFIMLLLTAGFTACTGNDDFTPDDDKTEYGDIELAFSGTTRATTTTISPEEAKNFLITVTQGDRILRGPQTLGTMSMKFPVGQGYKVFAESCNEQEAETGNDHWGQKRFTGSSAEFGINKGETTKASVGMKVANAAVCIIIDPSLANYFRKSCTLNITESGRDLHWNYDNAGKDEGGVITDGQIAYFNVDETGQRTIHYSITASAEGNITDKEGTITLKRAKMSRLKLKYDSGSFSLTVSVNEDNLYVDNTITITPDDVIADDGSTDASAGNDEFETDNFVPDYDTYE